MLLYNQTVCCILLFIFGLQIFLQFLLMFITIGFELQPNVHYLPCAFESLQTKKRKLHSLSPLCYRFLNSARKRRILPAECQLPKLNYNARNSAADFI